MGEKSGGVGELEHHAMQEGAWMSRRGPRSSVGNAVIATDEPWGHGTRVRGKRCVIRRGHR